MLFIKNHYVLKKFFHTSLKDKKQAIIKNKAIEELVKFKQNQIDLDSINMALGRLDMGKFITKIGLIFLIPMTCYYINCTTIYPINSKQLTDIFNSNLNLITTAGVLFV